MRTVDCLFVLTPTVLKQIEKMEKKSQEQSDKNSGAVPKSRLGAIRKSFKLGSDRKKEGEEKAPKKAKKEKSKEEKPTGEGKPRKTSKTSSLVRKLSIGKYRQNRVQSAAEVSETPSTTPEMSPTVSKLNVSEDDVLSSSSGVGGRQGPEGDDGISNGSGETAVSSPPVSPPPEDASSQSVPIVPAIESQLEESVAAVITPPVRIALQSRSDVRDEDGMRKESDGVTLEPLPVAEPEETTLERDDPSEKETPVDSSSVEPSGSGQTEDSTLMSQELAQEQPEPNKSTTTAQVTSAEPETQDTTKLTTKGHILAITTPLVKRQQELVDECTVLPNIEEEAGEFGDIEEFEDAEVMASSPVPADAMDEARSRLSQSLGGAAQVGEKREHLYKILVIGELGTGKTSIIKRYVHQFFSQHYRATIGVDFALKVLNWDTHTIIRLQLWDIAGQERFGNMTRVYYKEAVGAFIVFDVTRAATFDAVVKWKQDLDAKVQLPDGSPIPCVLLANKCDQQKEGIVNNSAKMEEYCKEKGFSAWYETSAKENINIEDAARCLVTKILQNDRLIHHNDSAKDLQKFALDGKGQKDQKEGKSCSC